MFQKSKFAKSNLCYSAGNWQDWAIGKLQGIYTGDVRRSREYPLIGKLETKIGSGDISLDQAKAEFIRAIAR